MFVERKSVYELPENAVIIDESEALKFYMEMINNRKYKKEAVPFTYGLGIASVASMFSSGLLGFKYRRRVKAPDTGKIVFFTLTGGMGFLSSFGMNYGIVQRDILLQKDCIFCTYLKAIGSQIGSYLFGGMLTGGWLSLQIANHLGVVNLPAEYCSGIRSSSTVFSAITKKLIPEICFVSLINAVLIVIIVFKQYNAFDVISQKAMENERRILHFTKHRDDQIISDIPSSSAKK